MRIFFLSIVIVYIVFKNISESILAKTESITTSKVINDGLPFGVDGFVRNLPEGWHPSAEKIAQAAKMGIELGSHQTYVNPYMKNVA